MKQRLLAVSDIHGCYEEFKAVLDLVEYDSGKDQLVLLGDYVDRGPDSFKVVEMVIELVSRGAVALMGNHDQMFIDRANGMLDNITYYLNGGGETNRSYHGASEMEYVSHLEFLKKLPLVWETKDYCFVHAGFNPTKELAEQDPQDLLWIREEWLYSDRNPTEKIVVFGHSVASYWYGSETVHVGHRKIDINTGAGCGGFVSLVDLTNKKVHSLKGTRALKEIN